MSWDRKTSKSSARYYDISAEGDFEGRIHLVRKNSGQLLSMEEKLLAIRKEETAHT